MMKTLLAFMFLVSLALLVSLVRCSPPGWPTDAELAEITAYENQNIAKYAPELEQLLMPICEKMRDKEIQTHVLFVRKADSPIDPSDQRDLRLYMDEAPMKRLYEIYEEWNLFDFQISRDRAYGTIYIDVDLDYFEKYSGRLRFAVSYYPFGQDVGQPGEWEFFMTKR